MKSACAASLAFTVLFSAAQLSAAPFEGVMEMKMTVANGSGKVVLSIGKQGVVNEMEMNAHGHVVRRTALLKNDEPKMIYMVDRETKTYSVLDMSAHETKDTRKYTVQKLGKEKVNGWESVHSKVTDDQGTEFELWTNDSVADWRTFVKAMGQRSVATEGMMAALEKAGAGGFITKLVARDKQSGGANVMTVELVKVEKKALPASTFAVPAGFTKQEAPSMGGQLTPEAQKQLMERLKELPPEQQEAIRRAMQQQGQK